MSIFTYTNTKWDLSSQTQEERVLWQEKCFELGFKWEFHSDEIQHETNKLFYLYKNTITYEKTLEQFNRQQFDRHMNRECKWEDMFTLEDPYAELKQAHKDGKIIELLMGGNWEQMLNIGWHAPVENYRVKVDEYAELKQAYADGKTIELRICGEWGGIASKPSWAAKVENYRIQADPYAELKQAHKDGKHIEVRTGNRWERILSPSWHASIEDYRIQGESKVPHVHADLIKAWADGAKIEQYQFNRKWVIDVAPVWNKDTRYRIKPSTKMVKLWIGTRKGIQPRDFDITVGDLSNLSLAHRAQYKWTRVEVEQEL